MERTVTVTASATVDAVPDMAQVTSGLVTEAATAGEALKRNSDVVASLVSGLNAFGIDVRDIATRAFHVEPRYVHERDGRSPRVDGYQVTNEVAVTVRDLDRLGNLLDEMVRLGANKITGLSFGVSTADKLKDEARRKAIASARRKAELYAKAAGAQVGQVLAIAEEAGGPMPRPHFAARAATADAVPIEKGTQRLEAQVSVTWALK